MYALVLAGGKGERLRPLTDRLPKPMVPVAGKPILGHQVEWLKRGGVTDVMFLAGYRWEVIQEYFGDGGRFGIRAHYSIEETPLGRGGAIRKGLACLPGDVSSVVALNGDIITAQELGAVLDCYRAQQAAEPAHLATIMLVSMVSPYGLADTDSGDRVVAFREKAELPYWVNAGVYVLDRRVEPHLPELGDHETGAFPLLARAGRLGAFKSRAFWRSVDSFKDLREAEEYLSLGSPGRPG